MSTARELRRDLESLLENPGVKEGHEDGEEVALGENRGTADCPQKTPADDNAAQSTSLQDNKNPHEKNKYDLETGKSEVVTGDPAQNSMHDHTTIDGETVGLKEEGGAKEGKAFGVNERCNTEEKIEVDQDLPRKGQHTHRHVSLQARPPHMIPVKYADHHQGEIKVDPSVLQLEMSGVRLAKASALERALKPKTRTAAFCLNCDAGSQLDSEQQSIPDMDEYLAEEENKKTEVREARTSDYIYI